MMYLIAQIAEEGNAPLVRFLQTYWPTLLPVVLGLVGVYLLLPQAGRFKPLWGAIVCAAGLIAAGILVAHADMVLPETVLFYAFSAIALVGGVLLITQTNPVHAALSFALVVLSTCGLFLLQGAPFLMASTIIVYAGAIIVTFLFVIMLAQQAGGGSADQRSREPFLATLAAFVLLAAMLCVLQRNFATTQLDHYLEKLELAVAATTPAELTTAIGEDREQFLKELEKLVPNPDEDAPADVKRGPLAKTMEEYHDALVPARQHQGDLTKLKIELAKILNAGRTIRHAQGLLQPDPAVAQHMSPSTRVQARSSAPTNKEGLPAENVAGLGRMLFTDYLLPIELAAVLLLAASIGAAVIAGRRTEGVP